MFLFEIVSCVVCLMTQGDSDVYLEPYFLYLDQSALLTVVFLYYTACTT